MLNKNLFIYLFILFPWVLQVVDGRWVAGQVPLTGRRICVCSLCF